MTCRLSAQLLDTMCDVFKAYIRCKCFYFCAYEVRRLCSVLSLLLFLSKTSYARPSPTNNISHFNQENIILFSINVTYYSPNAQITRFFTSIYSYLASQSRHRSMIYKATASELGCLTKSYVIVIVTVTTRIRCAALCLAHGECVSFNFFRREQKNCHLSSDSIGSVPDDGVNYSTSCTHYE